MNAKYAKRLKLLVATGLVVLAMQAVLIKQAYADNPSRPQGITASIYSKTAGELFWQASTDSDGIAFYRVYIAGTLFRQTPGPSIYIDTLSPERHYDIQISAVDRRGNASQWSPVFRLQTSIPSTPPETSAETPTEAEPSNGDTNGLVPSDSDSGVGDISTEDSSSTEAPAEEVDESRVGVPQDIEVVSRTATSIEMSWSPDAGFSQPLGYNVYLGTSYIATTFNSLYTIKGLDPATTYRVVLTAFDDAGQFSVSTQAVIVQTRSIDDESSTTEIDTVADTAPATDTGIDTDNETDGSMDQTIADEPADSSEPDFSAGDLAVDSSDEAESAEENASPPADVSTDDVDAVGDVSNDPVMQDPVTEEQPTEGQADPLIEDSEAVDNEPVFSAVDAVVASPSVVGIDDFFGRSLEIDPSVVSAGEIPSTPKNLRANLIGNDWVELNWAPANDDGQVVAYKIYRDDGVVYELSSGDGSDDVETNTTLINYWDTTTYVDCNFTHVAECHTGLTPEVGARHVYQVTAIDNEGNESERSQGLDVQLHAASNGELLEYVDPYMDGDDRFIFDTDLSNPENFLDQFELVFSDEFNALELDADKWSTSLTFRQEDQNIINGEMQYFVDTQRDPDFGYDPFILNGETLTISAIRTPPELLDRALGQEFLSGALSTHHLRAGQLDDAGQLINDKFATTYGYVEGRIRVGTVSGMLTSFYLFRRWAGEHSPEIDIVEYLGENPFGEEKAFQTYHYNDVSHDRILSSPTMFYPREQGGRQSMNIILYLVTGSAWAPRPADDAPFPLEIEVDYVRAYKRLR